MKPIEIQPYQLADGTWVFDDARAGLVEEPLIEGTDRLIEAVPRTMAGGVDHGRPSRQLHRSDVHVKLLCIADIHRGQPLSRGPDSVIDRMGPRELEPALDPHHEECTPPCSR